MRLAGAIGLQPCHVQGERLPRFSVRYARDHRRVWVFLGRWQIANVGAVGNEAMPALKVPGNYSATKGKPAIPYRLRGFAPLLRCTSRRRRRIRA